MSQHSNLFKELLTKLQQNSIYEQAIDQALQKYIIKPYNVQKLTPSKIAELYDLIDKKFYSHYENILEPSWHQNQLRVYIWLLVGYCFLNKKQIKQLIFSDWEYFSRLFNNRDPNIFQFQGRCLLKNQNKLIKWSSEQVQMLMTLIDAKDSKKKWNQVAKELFIRSKKNFFRTGKQCRQRWLNHLDPNKVRSAWTKQEDQLLVNFVLQNGKKWSHIVKQLGNTRTEHMVKNRFKSLYNFQARKNSDKSEQQIINIMSYKLENNISIKQIKGKKRNQKQSGQNRIKSIDISGENKLNFKEEITRPNLFTSNSNNVVNEKIGSYIGDNIGIGKQKILEQECSKSPSIFWNYPQRNSQCLNCVRGNTVNNLMQNEKWQLQFNLDYGVNKYMGNGNFDE